MRCLRVYFQRGPGHGVGVAAYGSAMASTSRSRNRSPLRLVWGDSLIILVIFIAGIPLAKITSGEPTRLHIAVGLVLLAPQVFRRRYPRGSTVVVAIVAVSSLFVLQEPSIYDFAVMLALYSAATYGSWRWGLSCLLFATMGGIGLLWLSWGRTLNYFPNTRELVLYFFIGLATTVLPWALGILRRMRLEQSLALLQRLQLLETERTQQIALATAAERARIAREMHDVVAHSLAIVIAQADGGRFAAADNPQAAVGALDTIADTARSALAEMRRLLGVLRQEEPAGSSRDPQPGLDQLPALVASLGHRAALEITGAPRPVPPGLALTVFRLVQESLTNTLRHAGPRAQAYVTLVWESNRLDVSVVDDGLCSSVPKPAGHGLIGMRERVLLDQGSFSAGPVAGGGFAVRASLPLDLPAGTHPMTELMDGSDGSD